MTSPAREQTASLVGDLAQRLDPDSVPAWTRFALRTRSRLARDVLREAGETARLGHVLAVGPEPDGRQRGLELLDGVVRKSGAESLPGQLLPVYGGLLLGAGRDEDVERLLKDPDVEMSVPDRWVLRTDLANPHRLRAGARPLEGVRLAAREERWLRILNEVHEEDDLEQVALRPPAPGETPYRRLDAPTRARVDGDLVSVVMSAHDPDADLLLAVRGVLEQTWHNLELLIIDDASTAAGTNELLRAATDADPRVRVIRAPHNRGTYEARNLALTRARGRWVTFQDSDDWTHPRRIEHQVRHLLDSPKVLANRTWTLRAYPDLTMTFVGYPPARLNASSLLFDRLAVRSLVGDFDATRKSGDMELPLRLRAVRRGSVRDLRHPAPLAITQLRPGSLSRGDAVPGWTRWDRLAYRDSYLEWHRQLAAGRLDPVLHAGRSRPFPLPRARWRPDRDSAPEGTPFDVVVLGDLRRTVPAAHRALGVARTAADAGLRTGVAHAESPHPLAEDRVGLLPALSTDARRGRLHLTNAGEEDTADLLVVTDPAGLLHVGGARLRPRTVLVVADEPEPEGWSVSAVEARCRGLFGTTPLWGGPARVHDRLEGPSPVRRAVPPERWCTDDLAPVAGRTRVGRTGARRQPSRPDLPGGSLPPAVVLGHHLADESRRWPSAEGSRRAYPSQVLRPGPDGAPTTVPVEVHALHGLQSLTRSVGRDLPDPSWCSFRGTAMTHREFLSHIDVWAYFGEWDAIAEIGALEALDAGLPLLLTDTAATSDLAGAVVHATPEAARDALAELLGPLPRTPHTADRRRAEWSAALTRLTTDGGPTT